MYWRAAGFDVVDCTRLQPSRFFTEVSAAEVFDFVSRRTPREADAVFIGGNGMRTIGALRALEDRLRRPVLGSNQVLMWEALRRFGRPDVVTGFGSIFGSRPRTT